MLVLVYLYDHNERSTAFIDSFVHRIVYNLYVVLCFVFLRLFVFETLSYLGRAFLVFTSLCTRVYCI